MATVTKLTPTGIHYSGEIDEATFNPNSGYKKNLIQYSQQLNNYSYWRGYCARGLAGYNGDTTNFTYNVSEVAAPDGTSTATKFETGNVQACGVGTAWGLLTTTTGIFTANTTYTVSIWAKVKEGTALFDLGLNDYYTSYGNQLTTEWRRITYTATPNGVPAITLDRGIQFTCTNKNVTVYVWGPQLEIGSSATIYEPTGANAVPLSGPKRRVDSNGKIYISGTFDEVTYNPTSPVIKNLFKYTETFFFDYTNWTLNNGLMTQNATLAPDGVSLAPKLIEYPSLSNQRIYNWMPLTAGTIYTYSLYLKAAERYIVRCYVEDSQVGGGGRVGQYLNLRTGTIISTYTTDTNTLLGSKLEAVGNGWYRYSWTVRAVLSVNLNTTGYMIVGMAIDEVPNFNYVGDGNSGIYIWGAQKEIADSVSVYQGIGATTLIPTKFKQRLETQGNHYVASNYDEYTGITAVTDGLILNLDGASTTSYPGTGNIWYDISGNGYATQQNNPTNLFSPYDLPTSSFRINNTNQGGFQVSLSGATAALGTPSFTFEAWVRHTSFNAGNETGNIICIKETYITNGFRCGVGTTSGLSTDTTGYPQFWTSQSGGNISLRNASAVGAVSLNTWYQLAVSYNANTKTAKMYLNGNLIATQFNVNYLPNSNYGTTLGTNSQGCNSMNGNIGVFKWYNRELGADEVNNSFQGLRGRYQI